MRGETLLILGHWIKDQCQLWHSVYKTLWARYRLQFLPNHFQTLHISLDDERRNLIDFGSRGQRSRSTLALLCIRPCGHDSDYSICSITFKLHMLVVDDERRNPIDFGSQGHRSRSTLPPARGCQALCCLIHFVILALLAWLTARITQYKWNQLWHTPSLYPVLARE